MGRVSDLILKSSFREFETDVHIPNSPSEDSIKAFGIKHVARDLAKASSVPIVPGTKGLVESEREAIAESEALGFPVMLKITAGGGGSYLFFRSSGLHLTC
jgi:acetyl/propionyl-CoA carboxylase alpha subunit